jgi:periplasmic copper chaperone A
MRTARAVLGVLALGVPLCLPLAALAEVELENPWARATPPGAKMGAGYLVIRNKASAPDRLVSASSPSAARMETHVTQRDGEVMRMREVKGYDIPAGGSFELKPGGAHLMFIDIKQPFKEGERIPVTLRFEKAGEKTVEFAVRRGAPMSHGHGH